jgi:LmbE family N-acetylglucosaminyl deacetylase
MVGRYSVQVQLDHPTSSVRQHDNADVRDDLEKLLAAMQPQVVYLHQPADKHDTHVATLAHALAALRSVPPARRPRQVWGCEVWRGLDWVDEDARHALDVSAHAHLAASLVGVFDSQIAGGKRYDLATAGRRLANATFHEPRAPDRCGGVTWAVDLLPLLREPELTLAAYTDRLLKRFVADVNQRVRRYEAPR